jgi:SAM-dependent methyltransferase
MNSENSRETGIVRVTASAISKRNQHYIIYHFLKEDIRRAAHAYAKGKLLDIGCGNKPYHGLFSKVDTYTGCDIVQSSENIVDHICPATELCFGSNEFDTVFSTQVIEHVADFDQMIAESFRVLKEGGYGIYTAPFSWELHEEPYDFFRFTRHGLRAAFEKGGFEIVEIRANGGKWAALFQLGLNVLFSTRKYNTWRSRLVSLLFVKLRLVYLYNKLAVWLDKRFYDDLLTLNYIIVIRKPAHS